MEVRGENIRDQIQFWDEEESRAMIEWDQIASKYSLINVASLKADYASLNWCIDLACNFKRKFSVKIKICDGW